MTIHEEARPFAPIRDSTTNRSLLPNFQEKRNCRLGRVRPYFDVPDSLLSCRVVQKSVKGNQRMSAAIIERQESSVTIQISIPLTHSMLETEEAIQQALNQ